jgi:hypothetical protein
MRYKTGLAVVTALVIATPAFADEWDFMLTNSSGKEIKLVEIAPTGTTNWQKNKVDEEVKKVANIKATGRATIHFDKDAKDCRFDLKATFVDDTNSVWSNVNVCDNAYVTIKYNASGAPTFTTN